MFNFTTTTFIHDGSMIEANPATGSAIPSSNVLRLGNKLFKYQDVVAIYRHPYTAASNAKLYVDIDGFMSKVTSSDSNNPYKDANSFKLDFYIKRSGDVNSYYSNDFVFKGKDFHYEWTKKQKTSKAVAKMINKILKMYGDVYLKVYTEHDDTTNHDLLVIENDNYGMFTEAQLKVFLPEYSDCCVYREGGWDIVDALGGPVGICSTDDPCNIPKIPYLDSKNNTDYYDSEAGLGGWLRAEQGVNGTGTYEQILKDLRLPTLENFRWLSPNSSEMPIPGVKYVQYTIHQISCRGILGGSAVGEVTHSKTTHVFFVPTCGCDENDLDNKMKTAIQTAGMGAKMITTTEAKENVGALVDDPVNNPVTVENFEHDTNIKANTVNITENTNEEP